ncbi:MAG: tetratricopeptide (TPR) repeat protein [Myxococcota bacterium]|jgi:tetratricopeptide (TPR) repeat protein
MLGLALGLVLLAPQLAEAQSRSRRALQHYNEGLAAMKLEAWDAAIVDFTAALKLRPDATIYYALGLAHERKGQNVLARGFYDKVLAFKRGRGRASKEALTRARDALNRLNEADALAERQAERKAEAQRLAARRASLVVNANLVHAQVHRGSTVLGPADGDTPLRLEPGPHELVVRAPGHVDHPLRVALRPAQILKLLVVMTPLEPPGLSAYDIAGISVASLAAASLATAAVLTVQANDTRNSLAFAEANGSVEPESRAAVRDWIDRTEAASYGLYAIAGVGAVTALTLLLLPEDDDVSLGLVLAPHQAQATFRFTF